MSETAHPAPDRLAELDEGLLPAPDAAATRSHVATCEPCSQTLRRLAALRELLAEAGPPDPVPLPVDVAQRLDAALRAAAATPDSLAGRRAAHAEQRAGRARGRAGRLLAAAAGVAVLGGAGWVGAQVVGGGGGTAEVTAGGGSDTASSAVPDAGTPDAGAPEAADRAPGEDPSAAALAMGVDLVDAGQRARGRSGPPGCGGALADEPGETVLGVLGLPGGQWVVVVATPGGPDQALLVAGCDTGPDDVLRAADLP